MGGGTDGTGGADSPLVSRVAGDAEVPACNSSCAVFVTSAIMATAEGRLRGSGVAPRGHSAMAVCAAETDTRDSFSWVISRFRDSTESHG